LKRSSGFVDRSLAQCSRGDAWKASTSSSASSRSGDLRQAALELRDGLAEPLARLLAGVGPEDRADQRAEHAVPVAPRVPQAVSKEVHGAALPGAPSTCASAASRPGVRVRDRQADADQAARDEPAQERAPERLGLGGADV
jgi:hypothetical protein